MGGTFAGVSLRDPKFDEPPERSAAGDASPSYESKWDRTSRLRWERFGIILHAIDRLILWAKDEQAEFAERVIAVPQRKRVPVVQAEGLPYVPEYVDFCSLGKKKKYPSSSKAASSSLAVLPSLSSQAAGRPSPGQPLAAVQNIIDDGEGRIADMHRRKRFRGAVPKRPASAANNMLDLLGDAFLGNDLVHDAVEELGEDLGNLGGGQPLAALVAKHDVLMSVAGAVVQEGGHDDGDEVESMPTSSSSEAEAADPEDLEDLPASAPATASSISSMLGRDSKHAINVQPQPLASDDVSGGWVVSKNAASGTWRFVPASDHFRGLRGQRDASHRHAKTRNHFLSQCEILFGPDAITANRSDECLHEALSVVEGACKGRLWESRKFFATSTK